MPINKETQVNASVVLDKEIYERLKEIAKDNERSVSGQMAFVIKNFVNDYCKDKNRK